MTRRHRHSMRPRHGRHRDPDSGHHEYDYHMVEAPEDYECPPIIELPPAPCLDPNGDCDRPCHIEYVLTMGECPHNGEPKYDPANYDGIEYHFGP